MKTHNSSNFNSDRKENSSHELIQSTPTHRACLFHPDKEWLNCQYTNNGQTKLIKKPDQLENEMKDPPQNVDEKILDRIQGSLIGMALGDALGAHVEFRPHDYLTENPVHDLQGGGTWGLQKGQFTDDTSMALCLANSLIARCDFVPYDQLVRYRWWHLHGYMSSTGECFDIGSATNQSLTEFGRRQTNFANEYHIPIDQLDFLSDVDLLQKFDIFCSEDGVAGNGALMRLAPVPLFFYKHPIAAVEFSGISGLITHGDEKAYDACRYYGALIVAALHGQTKNELLDKDFYVQHKQWFNEKDLHPEIMKIAQGSYKRSGGYKDGIRGKGYIVNALEAALWAFWSDENSFQIGARAAVNLGDDTDTTAAIYGQLAGAYYGYRNLPCQWIEQLYAKKFIQIISKWIVYQGQKWSIDTSTQSIIKMVQSKHKPMKRLFPSISKDNSVTIPIISQSLPSTVATTLKPHNGQVTIISSHKDSEPFLDSTKETWRLKDESPIIQSSFNNSHIPKIFESQNTISVKASPEVSKSVRDAAHTYENASKFPVTIAIQHDRSMNKESSRESQSNSSDRSIPINIQSKSFSNGTQFQEDIKPVQKGKSVINDGLFSLNNNGMMNQSTNKLLRQQRNLATWTVDDVYHWIQSLGQNYTVYAERFLKRKFDGYQLFRYVNIHTLINLEITNEEHQQKILHEIQQLKQIHMDIH